MRISIFVLTSIVLSHVALAEKPKEEVIDLGTMNDASASTATTTGTSTGTGTPSGTMTGRPQGNEVGFAKPAASSGPVFKALFDLILDNRPGVTSWTFDNYHTLLLADFFPRPDVQFSFEVNPTPRYYELDWDVSRRLQLRIGRIWIPFDDMNPHNYFGGYINTSFLRPPNTVAFLPDIWADMGVGAKVRFIDTKSVSLVGHLYAVNGFGSGGVDPLGSGKKYPLFTQPMPPDNNTDKAIGGRLRLDINQMFGIGASFYTCRWTSQGDESRRIMMFGLDGSLRFPFGMELRGGDVYMNVGLPTGASADSFQRGGLYFGLKQKFLKHWFVFLLSGIVNADNRIDDVNSQTMTGTKIGYTQDWFEVSAEYHRDIHQVTGKINYDYTALRIVVML